MSIRDIIRIVGIVTCFGFSSFGQATESEELSRGAGAVSADVTARQLAEDAINAKGWLEGVNKSKSGNDIYVAIGTAQIQAPIEHPSYLASRSMAFSKAQLAAWSSIRMYLGRSVSANAKSVYQEMVGEMPVDEQQQTATQAKISALLNGVLDKSLEKMGIDPATATPEQKEKAIASEEFSESSSTVAAGPVIGVQAFATFEGPGTGTVKGYEIAVVAIWSEKLQKLAESMLTLNKLPPGIPGKPVKNWIPSDEVSLLSTFGVQMISDENGYPVLIAYGQAGAATESTMSVNAAFDKAEASAVRYLRYFAGSQAKVMDDFLQAESSDVFADQTKEYSAVESFEKVMEVKAPAKYFSGISRLDTWSMPHPITKKTTAGVIVMWRPENALLANTIGAKMAAPPRASASQSLAAPRPARQSLDESDKGLTGSGATASDDF